ncbi:MAG TPA: prenyltransferase/squalene oxidase repeat-containing protein [Solirubrobacterales bacterium]|nr:prenyltransferase/squalene oxidase repeat-containing protein [Solirubrobacterales bacterium]
MSWQLTSFLIVGAVLIGGFAWYERSRPPSQVVALVAALAALAIAGRVAFAAFPNVKPTTDIVVFAGYALGPAPGFAVGALTGLVSNFWFGQGPWTPWQMAGWGLCGVMGAALALGARNASRLTLAAVCGFAGIAYGLLLNFSLMATYGGDLSIQRFLALEARAIPFDLAHAIGNVAFALLAGPAMVRMLVRFRERFEWRTPAVATTVLVALLLPAIVPGSARAASAGRAADWLESVQNSDGGFGSSPGDPSGAAITGWAMLGLEAAGRNPLDVSRAGTTPVDFLRSHIDEMSSSGDLARTIVALEGAGVDPRSFAGQDLVDELRGRRADNGSFEGWPGTTAYSAIALRTAGATGGLDKTLSWLGNVQNGDGGWGDEPGQPSNADVTAAVMQAIPDTAAGARGLSYLRKHQHSNGGFALGGSGGVNSQSTGWAVQGMIAVGTDPAGVTSGGNSPLDYLTARQESDGHFRYSASSDQTPVWVTAEALVAAAGDALPISPPPRKKTPAPKSSTNGQAGSGGSLSPAESLQKAEEGAVGGATPSGGTPALPPATSGAIPAPGAKAGGPPAGKAGTGGQVSGVLASEPVAATGTAPSPWIPIGIGLAVASLAIAVPCWLGRRYGW